MILYRVAGRAEKWRGGGLLFIRPIVGTNCAEIQKEASVLLKRLRKEGVGYNLRLQKLTVRDISRDEVIELFKTEDPSTLLTKVEGLELWTSEK